MKIKQTRKRNIKKIESIEKKDILKEYRDWARKPVPKMRL